MRLIKISMCRECPYYKEYSDLQKLDCMQCLMDCNINGIAWRPALNLGCPIHPDCPLEKVPGTENGKSHE